MREHLYNWNLSYSFKTHFLCLIKHRRSCEGRSQSDHVIWACLLPMPMYERLKEVGYRNASAWKKSFYLWPLTNASPAVTSVSPVNILKVVVLPAPFTPEVDMEKVSNIKRTFSLTTSFRHQMVQLYTWISCIQILRLNEKHKLTVNSLFEHSFYTFVVIYFRNICTLSAYIL